MIFFLTFNIFKKFLWIINSFYSAKPELEGMNKIWSLPKNEDFLYNSFNDELEAQQLQVLLGFVMKRDSLVPPNIPPLGPQTPLLDPTVEAIIWTGFGVIIVSALVYWAVTNQPEFFALLGGEFLLGEEAFDLITQLDLDVYADNRLPRHMFSNPIKAQIVESIVELYPHMSASKIVQLASYYPNAAVIRLALYGLTTSSYKPCMFNGAFSSLDSVISILPMDHQILMTQELIKIL
jgi:hypothetical protein